MEISKPTNLAEIEEEKLFGINPHQGLLNKIDGALEIKKEIETPVGKIRVQPKSTGIKVPSGGFKKMDDHQKENAAILCQTLYSGGQSITPEDLYAVWPITGIRAKLAGNRPEVHDLANFMASKQFAEMMADRDVDWEDSDVITPQQMATVQFMSVNTGSQLSKLRKCGVTTATWKSWMRQRKFVEYYKSVMESHLKDSIPEMKAALANKAMEGDVNALKFAFEVTGEYNPNYKSAVDAQALIGAFVDVMVAEIKDKELLGRIQQQIAFKAQAIRGIG